eukprot:6087847-Lingulodinium_polyedra.AAC.1
MAPPTAPRGRRNPLVGIVLVANLANAARASRTQSRLRKRRGPARNCALGTAGCLQAVLAPLRP